MSNGSAIIGGICGLGQQPVPRKSAVPEIAQWYALGLFRADFRLRYPVGEAFSEWDLVGKVNPRTGEPAFDMALARIKTDFRNYYSKSQRNRRLIAAGTPASGLIEGRSVRADGLGLGFDPVHNALVCELMEVTTVDEAQATIVEDIQPKVAMLRGPIKTLVERELGQARMLSSSKLPDKFIAYGTPWVIPPALAVVPIFLDTAAATMPNTMYRWICFAPTYQYRPMPFEPMLTASEPETAPARGLIVYSFHQAATRVGVPREVILRFRDWARARARAQMRLELLPTPEITRYWQDNNQDLKLMLGYIAAATFTVAVVIVAIYLAPVIAGTAIAYLTELAAAASVETLILQSSAIITAISATVPQILNFARTVVTAAMNLGPQFQFAP